MFKKLQKKCLSLVATLSLFDVSCSLSAAAKTAQAVDGSENQEVVKNSAGELVKGNLSVYVYSITEAQNKMNEVTKNMDANEVQKQHFYLPFFIPSVAEKISIDWKKREQNIYENETDTNGTTTEKLDSKGYYVSTNSLSSILKNEKFCELKNDKYYFKSDTRIALLMVPAGYYYHADISIPNFTVKQLKKVNSKYQTVTKKYRNITGSIEYGGVFYVEDTILAYSSGYDTNLKTWIDWYSLGIDKNIIDDLYLAFSFTSFTCNLSEPIE